jgi:fructan beta-fructosidase
MKRNVLTSLLGCICILMFSASANGQHDSLEVHRPQIHFSPREKWMNDPNGMVYHKDTYHLFYQYHPHSSVWGPMHWGHATSKNMIRWKHEPIALYPDSLGAIFSGSAVVDKNNTSGFGKNGQVPLVAIFTHHIEVEKPTKTYVQNQSLAYSVDDGRTWVKYAGNPVLKSPGIADFRDPKVIWYEPSKKWIMTLAVADRIMFYSSPNLKDWTKESEFGEKAGAHGGVWECPDLFSLPAQRKQVWVLIVNLNPGGPNKGSATQYFLGEFNGKTFSPYSTETKWLDYGPDEYAGVTWFNTGTRKIFFGWMSNWLYGTVVPTTKWRSAMTIPRELILKKVNNDWRVASVPVKELNAIQGKKVMINSSSSLQLPARLNLKMDVIQDFHITLSNNLGEQLIIGFDKNANQYYIDRTISGKTSFHAEFASKSVAPRFTSNKKMDMTLVIDVSSVELFADEGLSVMTAIFFPNKPYNKIQLSNTSRVEYVPLKSIW